MARSHTSLLLALLGCAPCFAQADPVKNAEKPIDLKTLVTPPSAKKEDWELRILNYVRFGSQATAEKFINGDKFDQIEIEKGCKTHRDELAKKLLVIADLKMIVTVPEDVEKAGVYGEITLPMRVTGKLPLFGPNAMCDGILRSVSASNANTNAFAFLTKDGTLKECDFADAETVRRNSGVLYHPDKEFTTLVMFFKAELDTLKKLARNATEYSVEIELTELGYRRSTPLAWGFYRRDAHIASKWNTELLQWSTLMTAEKQKQPEFFVSVHGIAR